MDEKLIIDTARMNPEGEKLTGEIDVVDINEEFVKPFGGIRYQLNVQMFGTEVLVRGKLEQDFELVCSRCGKDFDDTIKVEDFTASYEVSEKTSEIDITEDIRESVVLALPTYPVCDEACKGIERVSKLPADGRWNVLDGLKQ